MKLSVVMTVYNGERYLREAVESVLAQSVSDFEFLIVDDASTDGTPRILTAEAKRDSRIRLLHNSRNLGPYPSLNRALTDARGDLIARQDADDVSPPDRFAIQLAALDANPGASLVTGEIDVFGEQHTEAATTIRPPRWQPRLEWELIFSNVIGGGGHVMFPRVIHQEPILYATRHRYAEDFGLWCRLTRLGVVVCPAKTVYRYRRHASSITGRWKLEQNVAAAAIRRDYRSPYLPPDMPHDVAEELSRFWTTDGGSPLTVRMRAVYAHLGRVRSNFLAYVERRYGALERLRLEAELDAATSDRLGYWLFRSTKVSDPKALRDLMAIAHSDSASAHVYRKALRYATRAARRKLVSRRTR